MTFIGISCFNMLTNLHTIQDLDVKQWYVVYTRPHHEKRIFQLLQEDCIDAFLPLRISLKQWSDRRKKVIEPLFSCYLFVNITMNDYYKVLNVPGVVRFVSFGGKAAIISEEQIRTIKDLMENKYELEELPAPLQKGNRVRIMFGTLSGIDGELVMYNNKQRVIIRIEEISKSFYVNVPVNFLKLVG